MKNLNALNCLNGKVKKDKTTKEKTVLEACRDSWRHKVVGNKKHLIKK